MTSQMDIRRWIFDIRQLTSSQMDIQYSNVKHTYDQLPDGYLIFEYQTSIRSPQRWMDIQYLNVKHSSDQLADR